jgi:hypothetical protein
MGDRSSATNVLAAMVDDVFDYDPGRAERALDVLLSDLSKSERSYRKGQIMRLMAEISDLDPDHAATTPIRQEAHALIARAGSHAPLRRESTRQSNPHVLSWIIAAAVAVLLVALALLGSH